MRSKEIKVGDRFGRLVVVELTWKQGNAERRRAAIVQCDCGTEPIIVRLHNLLSINTASCGCLRRDAITTHGMSSGPTGPSPEYIVWYSMIQRCTNPRKKVYKNYGGRGITVCERWRESFENFYADMGPRPEGTSIDRIDVNSNYEPGNCRWALPVEQANNRRNNRILEHDGVVDTLANWARTTNINERSIWYRLRSGWSVEAALTTLVRSYNSKKAA